MTTLPKGEYYWGEESRRSLYNWGEEPKRNLYNWREESGRSLYNRLESYLQQLVENIHQVSFS